MATKMKKQFQFTAPQGRERYPWDEYLDGACWELNASQQQR
jgi:hypothetical protein